MQRPRARQGPHQRRRCSRVRRPSCPAFLNHARFFDPVNLGEPSSRPSAHSQMRRVHMAKVSTCILAFVAAVALGSSTAAAQTGKQIDVSAGYLQISPSMRGGNAQVAFEMTRRWSLIGEGNWSKGRDCSHCDPVYTDVAVLAGVRARWFRDARVSPFAQILGGVLHSDADDYYAEYCCGIARRLEKGYTINYAAIQPGVGVTAMVTPRIGIVAQGDLQFAIPDQRDYEGISI